VTNLGQKAEQEKRIFLVNPANVPVEVLDKKGVDRTQVQYLIDDRQGSHRFALRLYTIQKGGHTPLDQHPYEHHVFVMSGEGLLRQSKQPNAPQRTLKARDALFIPSNAVHQFSNEKDEPFTFLCVKGNPKLYVDPEQSVPSDSERNYC
jgi:quercetin dioxygenase-like cupin family protein